MEDRREEEKKQIRNRREGDFRDFHLSLSFGKEDFSGDYLRIREEVNGRNKKDTLRRKSEPSFP